MSEAKFVVAIADSNAEVDTELVFKSGDVIKVLSENTGSEGWWEGELNGRCGFFPESYVVPAASTTSLPQDDSQTSTNSNSSAWRAKVLFDYTPDNPEDLPVVTGEIVMCSDLPQSPEWVEAEKNGKRGYVPSAYVQKMLPEGTAAPKPPRQQQEKQQQRQTTQVQKTNAQLSTTASQHKKAQSQLPQTTNSNTNAIQQMQTLTPTPTTPVLPPKPVQQEKPPEKQQDKSVVVSPVGIVDVVYRISSKLQWIGNAPALNVTLTVGEKRAKKFGGMKTYTMYSIQIAEGVKIERRYKHFDWLQQRLREKFPLLALPTPPEKQFSGRFEEQFLESRRRHLERYLNFCTHHPILAVSSTIQFFFKDVHDESEWKSGKRSCEKDSKETGDKMLKLIAVESIPAACSEEALDQVSKFHKHAVSNERALIALHDSDIALTTKQATLMVDMEKLVDRWNALQSEPCWIPNCTSCAELAKIYGDFANIHSMERDAIKPETRTPHIADVMKHFGNLMSTFQDLTKRVDSIENQLTQKKKQADDRAAAVAINPNAVANIEQPTELPGLARATLLAEMHTFHQRKLVDMREALLNEAKAQLDYHKKMLEKWTSIASSLEQQQQKQQP